MKTGPQAVTMAFDESPSIICPRCGTKRTGETRFCRSCGTNLEAVDRVLSGKESQPHSKRSHEQPEHPLKELQRSILWVAVRGVVTLLIGLPFTFLMLLTTLSGRGVVGVISLILTLILLAFVILGFRDLLRAYTDFKNPLAALAKLNPPKIGEEEPNVRLSGGIQSEQGIPYATSPLPSVTEHTTLELEEPESSSSSKNRNR
jgi:hypothetical protein